MYMEARKGSMTSPLAEDWHLEETFLKENVMALLPENNQLEENLFLHIAMPLFAAGRLEKMFP